MFLLLKYIYIPESESNSFKIFDLITISKKVLLLPHKTHTEKWDVYEKDNNGKILEIVMEK